MKQNPFFPIKTEQIKTVDSGILVPKQAIMNADTNEVVSVMSTGYRPVSNKDVIDNFEDYLKGEKVNFKRTSATTDGKYGQRFVAKYRFPDISVTMDTPAAVDVHGGKVPDNVELALELFNSYDGSSKVGFFIGGFRLVCLNGLGNYGEIYGWATKHLGDEDIEGTIQINFQTAVEIFKNKLVKTWNEFTGQAFNQFVFWQAIKAMNLSQLYRNKLASLLRQKRAFKKLNNMWDAYNVITAFTSHYVEKRNLNLARSIQRTYTEWFPTD